VSVYALLPTARDKVEKTFAPEVPQFYLRNIRGNNTLSRIFTDLHHIPDPEELALAYVDQLVAPETYVVKDSYETRHNGITHVYVRQTVHDLEFLNADLIFNVWKL
jgi:extracellular elastinolytic metalloproteinase